MAASEQARDRRLSHYFAARWGSLAFFGPLTVRPDHWDRGIASRLMEPVVDLFDGWGIRLSGLFTFPGGTKRLGLYQKFGFWPQHVSAVMAREVAEAKDVSGSTTFTEARKRASAEEILDRCRRVTDTILPGLDLRREIDAVAAQDLGDTVLVEGDGRLVGFAVCHCGARTEAGSGACFIKFAAVSPGPDAAWSFEQLIQACEAMAAQRALACLIAGVNTGCHDAYRILLERGFRANLIGLTMLRPNEPGYPPADAYVISDLR
jgi:N-acetylglutamate synthase-like GNAT family acetyltransferase